MIKDEQIASYLHALSHPVRLEIVQELLKGPKNVSEVQHALKISQANTSQHLSVLRFNGVVGCTKKGTIKVYSLKEPEKIHCIMAILIGE